MRKDEERRPEVVARACVTIIGRDDSSCASIQPFHALTYNRTIVSKELLFRRVRIYRVSIMISFFFLFFDLRFVNLTGLDRVVRRNI